MYFSHARLPKNLRFATGDHPLRGAIGASLFAPMLVESIYFARNEIYGHAASALALSGLTVFVHGYRALG
jgi:hypothetical protein